LRETGRAELALAPVGLPGTVSFDGPAASFGILAWGLADVAAASPFGSVWRHPQAFQILAVGPLPLQVPVVVPNPVTPGLVIAAQGLLLGQSTLDLSNPVVATVP
jgi:hypothetical protein